MRRTLVLITGLIIVGIVVYLTVAGTRKETKAKPKANRPHEIPVETVLLKRGALERRLDLTGTVRSKATVDVFSKVSGILERIDVEQGDRVSANQVIALVERAERVAQVQEAEAALEVLRARWAQMKAGARPEEIAQAEEMVRQAKARLKNCTENFNRLKSLRESEVISQQRLDEARLQVTLNEAECNLAREKMTLVKKGARKEDRDALLAQIRQAEATMSLAQTRLDNTTIRAPITGIIGQRFVDGGAFVTPAAPIVRIVAMDAVKVIVQVVEREIAHLRAGAPAEIDVDAHAGEVFRGVVVRISPTIDPDSRTADVEIELDNRGHRLKPGMFARVSLVVQKREGVLLLARDALLRKGGPPRVFVHDHGRSSLREVRLGLQGANHVEVLSGLEEGDEVILVGHYDLRDGMSVKVLRRDERT